ncbi:hypothetical protein SLS63_003480 [Diaporthe eres]|uniref:AB hydrolase-1 domain-containing protein n=1 Tax=Diaporthe eres TaxID=83184 RepID=A0ABR1PHA2_DIAER
MQFIETDGERSQPRDTAECFRTIEKCRDVQSLAEIMGMRKFMAWNFVNVFYSGWSDDGGTIEFRRPPGVTNPDACLAWMELAVHFIHAARELQGPGFRLDAQYTRDVAGLQQFIKDGLRGRGPKPTHLQSLFRGKSGRIPPIIHIDQLAHDSDEGAAEEQEEALGCGGGVDGRREHRLANFRRMMGKMASRTVASPVALLRSVLYAFLASAAVYAVFLALLTVPSLQRQVIYLHSLTQTWGQDLNVPEQWGFLHNQVTPFALDTPDGETLHAWHILPLGLYRRHEERILEEPSGLAPNFQQRLAFELLRDDPESLLVLYLHGAGGTLGSGHRPASYRAASAGAPDRIHIVAVDYRGFGLSTGTPSEHGLLTDATTLVDWAMTEAGIPAHRIIIWGQSLGTAVATGLVHHMALRHEPILFSGLVLVAPFADVPSLTATYSVAGRIPVLGPIARFPLVFDFLNTFILDKWPTKERLAGFVRQCEALPVASKTYHISIIHAEDDLSVPWHHSEQLFWHAVNSSLPAGISFEELDEQKEAARVRADAGGWSVTHGSNKGEIREHITQYGVHDKIMGYPVVSLAVLKAFGI